MLLSDPLPALLAEGEEPLVLYPFPRTGLDLAAPEEDPGGDREAREALAVHDYRKRLRLARLRRVSAGVFGRMASGELVVRGLAARVAFVDSGTASEQCELIAHEDALWLPEEYATRVLARRGRPMPWTARPRARAAGGSSVSVRSCTDGRPDGWILRVEAPPDQTARLERALGFLGRYEGMGANRLLGWGRFCCERIGASPFAGAEPPAGWITLGESIPTPEERGFLHPGGSRLVRRRGYVSALHPTLAGRPTRAVWCAPAGSVFSRRPSGNLVGVAGEEDETVYRYGLALSVPLGRGQ